MPHRDTRLDIRVNTETSNQLIHVSTRTRSCQFWMSIQTQASNHISMPNQSAQSCQLWMSIQTQASNHTNTQGMIFVCFKYNQITSNIWIKAESQSIDFYKYLLLKVNRDWRSYSSYNVINTTWLKPSYYLFIAQLKFKVHINKIRENRFKAVQVSLYLFFSVI